MRRCGDEVPSAFSLKAALSRHAFWFWTIFLTWSNLAVQSKSHTTLLVWESTCSLQAVFSAHFSWSKHLQLMPSLGSGIFCPRLIFSFTTASIFSCSAGMKQRQVPASLFHFLPSLDDCSSRNTTQWTKSEMFASEVKCHSASPRLLREQSAHSMCSKIFGMKAFFTCPFALSCSSLAMARMRCTCSAACRAPWTGEPVSAACANAAAVPCTPPWHPHWRRCFRCSFKQQVLMVPQQNTRKARPTCTTTARATVACCLLCCCLLLSLSAFHGGVTLCFFVLCHVLKCRKVLFEPQQMLAKLIRN